MPAANFAPSQALEPLIAPFPYGLSPGGKGDNGNSRVRDCLQLPLDKLETLVLYPRMATFLWEQDPVSLSDKKRCVKNTNNMQNVHG